MFGTGNTDLFTYLAFFAIGLVFSRLGGYVLDFYGDRVKQKSKETGKLNWFYIASLIFIVGLILFFTPNISSVLGISTIIYQLIDLAIFLTGFIIIWSKVIK